MKTSSLYDVQKKAEEGGAATLPPRPTRPTKACICVPIVLSVLIMLSLAVALTVLMTGPDWLRLSRSDNTKWTTKADSRRGIMKPGEENATDGDAKQEIANTDGAGIGSEDGAAISTTASPPRSVIAIPTAKLPTTKVWFKEVIFFKPRPVKFDANGDEDRIRSTGITKAMPGATDKPKDANTNGPASIPTAEAVPEATATQTKTAAPGKKKTGGEQEIKPITTEQMFSRLWPDFSKMLSDTANKALPYLSMLFPASQRNRADQAASSKPSETLDKTTPPPSSGDEGQVSPAPTTASSLTTQPTPEDQGEHGKAVTDKTGQHAANLGLRFRRVPSWIYGGGGGGGGQGSYVRSYNRASNGMTRSWTVKDETRNGEKTSHSASDTGPVRLPERRASHSTRLVYDGATGTWRRAPLPDTGATWTPRTSATWTPRTSVHWTPRTVTVTTQRPWTFTSPTNSGAWGVYGTPGVSHTQGYGGATSDVFAAARRRLEAARRRIRQYQQNAGGFTGYSSWDR